ncbi:MAG TPA: MerR family transcriptional regulator [Actinomycetota bacterium]
MTVRSDTVPRRKKERHTRTSIEGARVRMEGFTTHQACKFTACTSRQLRYWDQIGLVEPSVQGTGGRPGIPRLYSFRDLVALRVVKSLLDGGMSLQRVRRSWEFLNKKAGMGKHLSEVRLVTDGQSIFKICRRDGEVMDALRDGQMAFFVAIDDIATGVETNVRQFEEDREKFVRALREAAAHTATGT